MNGVFMKINVLTVRYKKKVIGAIGVQNDMSIVTIEIDWDDAEEIKKDKVTMSSLPKYIHSNLIQSKGYLGEGDACFFIGEYGDLSIKIDSYDIKI